MQSPIVDETPHRARFAWVFTALVATVAAFGLTRPAHAHHHHHHHLQLVGHCR